MNYRRIAGLLSVCFFMTYSSFVYAQQEDEFVRIKHGLPNILKVTNVRVYSDSPTSAKISIWIEVKKGKIVSVSRGGSDWIITVRTQGKVSAYVVTEKSFKIIGEESKSVNIRALHFAEN